jgi:hypothetical protein
LPLPALLVWVAEYRLSVSTVLLDQCRLILTVSVWHAQKVYRPVAYLFLHSHWGILNDWKHDSI